MNARTKGSKKTSGGRGSKEAVQKRRAARNLNTLLTGGSKVSNKLDGRTEKRRQRLVGELKNGRAGKALKPIDFAQHVHELLEMGETISSLKKQGVKQRKVELTPDVAAAEDFDRASQRHSGELDTERIAAAGSV